MLLNMELGQPRLPPAPPPRTRAASAAVYPVYLVQYYTGHIGHHRRPNHLHIIVDTTDVSIGTRGSGPVGSAFFVQGTLAQGYRLVRKDGCRYGRAHEYRGRIFLGTLEPSRMEAFHQQLKRVEIRNYDPGWCHRQEWALAACRRLLAQGFDVLYLGREALHYRLREAEESWEQGDD